MKSRSPGFQPGNMWLICDRCGFAYRRTEMKQEWTGLMVCAKDWEPRHPQDFARGVKDEIAPEGPSRPGATDVFDAINKLFFINQMIVPGSVYWNLGFGLDKGEVKDDDEGINTMKLLGENMAWLLKKVNA